MKTDKSVINNKITKVEEAKSGASANSATPAYNHKWTFIANKKPPDFYTGEVTRGGAHSLNPHVCILTHIG